MCWGQVYSDEKRMKSEDGTYFHSDCYNRLVASNANASSPQVSTNYDDMRAINGGNN